MELVGDPPVAVTAAPSRKLHPAHKARGRRLALADVSEEGPAPKGFDEGFWVGV